VHLRAGGTIDEQAVKDALKPFDALKVQGARHEVVAGT